MSLGGGTYLEIIAPVPDGKSAPENAELATLETPRPLFFALRSTNLDETVRLLKANGFATDAVRPGSRKTPDGATLVWRTTGVIGAGLDRAPFFIEWGKGVAHPSATSPAGCRFAGFEVSDPAAESLKKLFSVADAGVAVVAGPRGLRLTLDCPKGTVVFGP